MTEGEHRASDPHTRIVETGYDHMAEAYLSTKDPEDRTTLAALEEMSRNLPSGASVLDLGCGAGIPVTCWLVGRGYGVVGVDVSARQLELARKYVPEATFIQANMTGLTFGPETFDAVVAFHSIIHVPREEHPELLADTFRWLKPGGILLATLTITAFDGGDEDWEGWGAAMRWSHHDAETNRRMLRDAGFEIRYAEPRTTSGVGGDETWLWVEAHKPS